MKGALAFILTFESVEADSLHHVQCDSDCEVIESRNGEFVARKVNWNLDLAIEAKPIFATEPDKIFEQLFQSVDKDGHSIAGKTETLIDLSDIHWSADFDCEKSTPREPRRCVVRNDSPRFQWHYLITGGPRGEDGKTARGVFAVSDTFYQGLPVIKPRVRVRVSVGWPTTGIQNIVESWRKPILESIYLILGHEKLHVDNFLHHLPKIAQHVLHPEIDDFTVAPGEDPGMVLDGIARNQVLASINRELFDPQFSECKRTNCIYDGKGPDCDSPAQNHNDRRVAAAWDEPKSESEADISTVFRGGEVEEKLTMLVDQDSYYPGPKSPRDFKFPVPFDFRWAEQ